MIGRGGCVIVLSQILSAAGTAGGRGLLFGTDGTIGDAGVVVPCDGRSVLSSNEYILSRFVL